MSIFKILKKTNPKECCDDLIKKDDIDCSSGCKCQKGSDSKVGADCNLSDNSNLKILGSGCKKCHTLYENVKECVAVNNLEYKICYINDFDEIAKSGVMSTPALMRGDSILSQGKMLSVDEIYALIK